MPDRGVVAGQVGDRPWATTLASCAMQRMTGEVVLLASDGKEYRVAFIDGVVVAASSPLASDSVPRIALTGHLVSSSQVAAIMRRLTAAPDRDEIDVVCEAARLTVEQVVRLRRRVIKQRAARTFSVDRGAFSFENQVTQSVIQGIEVDICAVIYLGIQMNLSEPRLADDLRRLGSRFRLHADADVSRFGFGDVEQPILDSLLGGASLPELDAKHRDVVPRTAQAIVYALVACGAAEVTERAYAATARAPVPAPVRTRTASIIDLQARAPTKTWPQPKPAVARTTTDTASPVVPRTITPRRGGFIVRETIAAAVALIERNADHFELLGVAMDAPLDAIRTAYVQLACQLHPDKLPELDPATTRDAHRAFATINRAFGVIGDPVRRAEYVASQPGAKLAIVEGRTPAEDAFHRGLIALRRDELVEALAELTRATLLAPHDVDYEAMLAWGQFCAAVDKQSVAAETRRALEKAIRRSPKPMMAEFYLGRVERMLGRVNKALEHFRAVLDLEPGHTDAATEIRMLEQRAAVHDRNSRR